MKERKVTMEKKSNTKAKTHALKRNFSDRKMIRNKS